MNQMEIFKNPEFGSIRTFEQDGKVLFCGTDVATALGYANPRKAVRDHTRCGTKCSIGVQTGKKADGSPAVQMVEMLFIPEGDVYRLIVHSKLPSAERFERWVFDEVLPSIRQHGAYLTREKLWEVATLAGSPVEALLRPAGGAREERGAASGQRPAARQGRLLRPVHRPAAQHQPAHHRQGAGRAGAALYPLFCWNAGTSTALRRAVCCPTPKAATRACSVSRIFAATATPAPTRW